MEEEKPLIDIHIKPLNIRKRIKALGHNVKRYVNISYHSSSETSTGDTSSSTLPSSPPPPQSRNYTYDVFLSFRGPDTRTKFTDHLFAALRKKSIRTFRDDDELPRGESISQNLLKAIEESRYAVVVLSQHYADSPWCLKEIAKINDCRKETGLKVFPVFYDVDPSDVRRQAGNHFKKAFEKHTTDKRHSDAELQRWKDALYEVGNLSGWDLKKDGHESQIIQKVVDKIFRKLNKIIHGSNEGLVGMETRLENMLQSLNVLDNHVKIVGLCGMGGIGKTTLAQVVFENTKSEFEGDCFLENVREVAHKEGLAHLQGKLLSRLLECDVNVEYVKHGQDLMAHKLPSKKYLIILDDVDHRDQLDALCDRKWYGSGSQIIITSRHEGLLKSFKVDEIKMVEGLDDGEDLELFKMKAFKDSEIEEEFDELAKKFVKYADGLPLALEVLGSSLHGRNQKFWVETLNNLKMYPDKKITRVLHVGYDELQEGEKRMFLDIACFFKGEKLDRVTRVLQKHSDHDIQILIEKSLIFIYENKLGMHDMIQEVGWEIVRQEHPDEPEKYRRLWQPEEIIRVFDQCKATSEVQSILLQCPTKDHLVHSVGDAFPKMRSLRLLKIWNVKFSGNIDYLSNELQTLEWHECPFDSFPSNFQPDKLVELHMISSCIKNLWMGDRGWRMLRHIDMSASKYLKSTPNFTEVPDLEKLVLQDCTSLDEVHPSLGLLKKLITLNMKNCKSIRRIPPLTGLESLQTLNLALCVQRKKLSLAKRSFFEKQSLL